MAVTFASYGRRLAALCLDWAMSWAVVGLISQRALGVGNWILLTFFLEVALLTSLTGQSAGQRMVHIRVVAWPTLEALTPISVVVRTVLLVLVVPPLITDAHSRGLHDRLARSAVIKV